MQQNKLVPLGEKILDEWERIISASAMPDAK
jgi:hypothetical protein